MGSSQGKRGLTSLKIKEEEGVFMRGLPLLDSNQNKVRCEGDNGELIGRAGSSKKSLQEGVLQQTMEGEREREIFCCGRLQMKGTRVVVLVVVGGSIQWSRWW